MALRLLIKRSWVRIPSGSPKIIRPRRDADGTAGALRGPDAGRAASADGGLGLVGIRHAHADGPIAERVDVAAMAKIGVGAWAPVPQLEIVPPHRPRLVRRRDRVEVDDEEAIADLDEFAEIIVLVDGVVAREPVALLRGGVRELAAAR